MVTIKGDSILEKNPRVKKTDYVSIHFMIHFLPDRTPESLIDLNCIEKRMVDTNRETGIFTFNQYSRYGKPI